MFGRLFRPSKGRHKFVRGTHRKASGFTGKHRASGGRHRTKSVWDTNYLSVDYKPRHGRGWF